MERGTPLGMTFTPIAVGVADTVKDISAEVQECTDAIEKALEEQRAIDKAIAALEAAGHLGKAALGAYSIADPLASITDAGGTVAAGGGGMSLATAGVDGIVRTFAVDGAATAAASIPPGVAAGIASQLHSEGGARDDKAFASIKRMGKAGHDAQRVKEALKKIQHERNLAVEQMKTVEGDLQALGLPPSRAQAAKAALKKAANAIEHHLTDADVAGAMRDVVGDPVRAPGSGKTFNHLQEVTEALDGIKDARQQLVRVRFGLLKGQIDAKIIAEKLAPVMDSLLRLTQTVERSLEQMKP